MHHDAPVVPTNRPTTSLGWALYHYERFPLVGKIVIALLLGVLVGYAMGNSAEKLEPFYKLILRMLGALATPLIFFAVVHSILMTRARGVMAIRMFWLLMLNTVVAILVGIAVANVMQPGKNASLDLNQAKVPERKPYNIVDDLLGKIPTSVIKPFVENDILGVIFLALASGVGLRAVRAGMIHRGSTAYRTIEDGLETINVLIMTVLHWVIALVPLAVFGVVARLVGTVGLSGFIPMAWFVLAVLVALGIQAVYYLVRLTFFSRFTSWEFLRGAADPLAMAFSTASSAATMPVTYAAVRNKLGVRDEAASLGILVGGTFNHDGTALYEAMAALFISQVIGQNLGFSDQLILVGMAVIASVGAAGIPEAGLVTMIAVFSAVKLPVEYIPLLLTVDWFLDRCRTAINVMGDMTVTCMLDGPMVEVSDEANRVSRSDDSRRS
ncbi:MAG: dicarboxylate/amino acid:cation symporter [Planctomycetia bacterium]|nr:dicarboxylate/amino acid:cation symporter [Planctomycetia bacterium]